MGTFLSPLLYLHLVLGRYQLPLPLARLSSAYQARRLQAKPSSRLSASLTCEQHRNHSGSMLVGASQRVGPGQVLLSNITFLRERRAATYHPVLGDSLKQARPLCLQATSMEPCCLSSSASSGASDAGHSCGSSITSREKMFLQDLQRAAHLPVTCAGSPTAHQKQLLPPAD